MLIALMRHGACLSKEINAEQPLSPVGRGQVERCARAMRLLGLRPDAVAASDRQRAAQTAEIAARALGFDPRRLSLSEALKPSAPAETSLAFLHQFDKAATLLVVGHLPNLGLLASHLLSPAREALNLGLDNGGLLGLEIQHLGARNGALLWLLKAQHLLLLAGNEA